MEQQKQLNEGLNIDCINNYVLVKPDMDVETSNIKGFYMDKTFNEAGFSPRSGTVVSVPNELYFNPDDTSSMPWLTEMELMVGDNVVYHYLSGITAMDENDGRFFEYNGEMYFFIKYDRIFTAMRRFWTDGIDPICLNGFVLIEPVKDQKLERYKEFLEIPEKTDQRYGIVKYIGSLVRHYGNMEILFHGPDQDNIKVDDLVVMDKNCTIPLEYPYLAKLDGPNVYYRVQRRYIIGKSNQ